jgi:hypothetical protein
VSSGEAGGTSYQYERGILECKLGLMLVLHCFYFGNGYVRTVTSERCFIDTPPSDALAVRAMLPVYPCKLYGAL